MTTLAERARSVHRRNTLTAARQTVTFRRDNRTVTITDAIGYEAEHEIVGRDGFTTKVISMEWLLPQDAVVVDGATVKPAIDDQITDSQGRVYEPMRLSDTQPEVASHCGDEFWLVHSKLWKRT